MAVPLPSTMSPPARQQATGNPKVLYTEILKSRSMTDSELITATEPN